MSEQRTTVLIVDDEPLARQGMCDLLDAHPDFEIMGQAGSVSDARKLIARYTPALVFLDIQLYGETGFDLLEDLPVETFVIFVTAFNQFAVRAFEVNALDYLVKPVSPERLTMALDRHDLRARLPQLNVDDSVYLQQGRTRWFEPLQNISAICSDNDHSTVWLGDERSVVVRRSLNEWANTLPAEDFMRIHRNSIVSFAAVSAIESVGNGVLILHILGFTETLQVSRRRLAEFRRRLAEFRRR
jgi:two-component system LytT family response regulator